MLKTKSGKDVMKLGITGMLGWPIDKEKISEISESLGEVNLIKVNKDQAIKEEDFRDSLARLDRSSLFIATETLKKTASTLANDFNNSLVNLQTDYIDLLEIKNIRNNLDLMAFTGKGGSLEKAKELKNQGLIRYIGASSYNIEVLEKLSEQEDIDVLFVEFNPLVEDNREFYENLSQNKILIGINPLAGILGAKEYKLVNYSLKENFLTNVIINIRNSKDIQSFIDSINKDNIEEEIANLMTEFKKYGDNYCRKCGLCYPCAVNMNIPRMLEINKELNDGDYSSIEEFYSYDKNASDCIRCGACEMRCPFSVPVRQIHIDTVGLIERYIDGNKEK